MAEAGHLLRGRCSLVLADDADAAPPAREAIRTRTSVAPADSRTAAVPVSTLDDVVGALVVERDEALEPEDVALAEAVARDLGSAIHALRLAEENERRLRQQAALVKAAEALTSDLRVEVVLRRLVDEVAQLLDGDAADCYLLDEDRRALRCAAVHGLPVELVGSELPQDAGVAGEAIERGRAVAAADSAAAGVPPHPAYAAFRHAIVAPVTSSGRPRGVLGVGRRSDRAFDDADLDVLEGFATLAALALRNAEAFAERSHQARVQRGFYRIASVLGEPLSLGATLDAVAQAANDALGGSFAAVVMPATGRTATAAAEGASDAVAAQLAEGVTSSDGVILAAAREKRLLAASRLAEDERFDAAWRQRAVDAGCRSLLAVPIDEVEREGVGIVAIFFTHPRVFTDDDLELARHLAGTARAAVDRSARFEGERAARSRAQQLARTGRLLATELEPSAVLDEVVRDAPRLVGVEACAIRVLEDGELVVSAAEGEGTEHVLGARSSATGWLSGDVVQSRAPVAVADAAGDERLLAADPLLERGYRAYLAVPLAAPGGALHGVLGVYAVEPKAWREEEIEALLALAGNASAALSNAELYQRVALEKERSFAILANIADGIVAVDRDGRVVLWNKAAEQITGVPNEEALGRTPLQVLGRNLEGNGESASGDRLLSILRGGEEVWLSLTEAIMRDPLGVVSGRIYAFRDISADRMVEQMKSDFVSTVSQELRRPLTSIYGFAETLLRQDVLFGEEERRTFLRYIASESGRLTSIVDALLNVARLDTGDLQVNLRATDVSSVVSDVVTAVHDGTHSNGHRFVVDLPEEPLAADADPEKLRQVLTNLVDNAIKFSPDGGTVTVAARRRGESVEVSVVDEGIGIPAGEQQRIFRKFSRRELGRGSDDAVGGAGLGLFIARGLVTAMGGRIWVTSSEGEGSSFTFALPVAPPVNGAA